MGRDPWSELSVQVSRRPRRCVPDPLLCLFQPAFVSALTQCAEIWLGPEFLNIVDSWMLYEQTPHLLARSLRGHHAPEQVRDGLRIWLRLRNEPRGLGGRLCWIRDALRESSLPAGMDEQVVARWEAMAEALDERVSTAAEKCGPVIAAMRDTATLGAVVPGAVLLSLLDRVEPGEPEQPILCRHLEAWGVPCRRLATDDDLVALDRGLLLHLAVEAGAAGFFWSGLRLAAVHLVVPGRWRLGDDLDYLVDGEPRPARGAWDDARAFWYALSAEDPHGRV
jgi:hypothetical protein